jgi:serine protease Do/serine protease DegQ
VIENSDEITITLLDNRTMHARVVGSDVDSDIAVLKVDADRLTQIAFAQLDSLRVGDYVVAIGNPFGFSNTVTSGIVSGLGRSNVNPDRNSYQDFIQTDASINPGNSGGALVNLRGQLVGINSAILSRTGGNIGIGFAIPVDMVRNVMDQLIEFGTVKRGLLGVQINSLTPDLAETYDLPDISGALVTDVIPGSAAEEAGIQIEDVIVSVNGEQVRDSGSLRSAIGLLRPGVAVEIGLIRDGRPRTVTAVLNPLVTAEEPAEQPEPAQLHELEPVFEGAEIVVNDRPGGIEGLLVARVSQDTPAYARGLRTGDVITHINRERIRDLEAARPILENASSVILQVQRGSRQLLILMR